MKALSFLREHGLQAALRKAGYRVLRSWDRAWKQCKADADALAFQQAHQPPAGLISVAIPVYNTDPALLQALAQSLVSQSYVNWEACLYSTGSSPRTDAVLDTLPLLDRRIRIQRGGVNEGIAGNTNRAVALCRGEWIALADHDDLLTPDALWRVAQAIASEDADVIYTDEDRITANDRLHTDPALKPDYSPDTLRSVNYICHLTAIRKALWDRIGGERSRYDGAQDHDLLLRLSEATDRFVHIPAVCYHWRRVATSASHRQRARCLEASREAVEAHMARIGLPGSVSLEGGFLRLCYPLKPLKGCVVVTAPTPSAADEIINRIRHRFPWHVNFRAAAGVHRFAAMNQAVAEAQEDLLLFVDGSVTKFSDGFWDELAMYAQREDVGMAAPLLSDAAGSVRNAGYVLGVQGGLLNRCEGMRVRGNPYLALSRNVSAVSPLCFMVRRAAWVDFDPAYDSAFGCADACLRMQRGGLRHVYTPHAWAVFAGTDALLIPAGERGASDLARFRAAWPDLRDPCWNPGLSDEKADYRFWEASV